MSDPCAGLISAANLVGPAAGVLCWDCRMGDRSLQEGWGAGHEECLTSACVLGWSAREVLCGWAGARVLMLLKRFQTVRDETLYPSGHPDP